MHVIMFAELGFQILEYQLVSVGHWNVLQLPKEKGGDSTSTISDIWDASIMQDLMKNDEFFLILPAATQLFPCLQMKWLYLNL